jgi:antitoxin component YwqK of YwqJK toxin-antitoxin module
METGFLDHLEISRNNLKTAFYFFLITAFLSCKNTRQTTVELLKSNTNLQLKNGVLFYKSDLFSGSISSFDQVNQTKNTSTYLKGKKNGEETKFFLNDLIAERRFYTNGLKTGIHQGFWNNGDLKFEFHFNKKGEYHGTVKEWYQNNQIFKAFNYKNGKEVGSQKMWQSNGNIRANYVVKNKERFGLIGLKKCYSVNIKDQDEF